MWYVIYVFYIFRWNVIGFYMFLFIVFIEFVLGKLKVRLRILEVFDIENVMCNFYEIKNKNIKL